MASARELIVRDPEILGGTPVFRGTRVPLQALFDSIAAGETLESFLEGFPSVTREMAVAALDQARELLSTNASMRVLLDECVNQRLRNYLPGYNCQSAQYAGFAGLKNGELLDAAESAGFDVLLTVDRVLEYEQNLTGRKIAIIVFRTKSIALKDLLPHIPGCLAALPSIKPGEIVKLPGG